MISLAQPQPERKIESRTTAAVEKLRLVRLTHSDDDIAAAIATVGLLLMRRLDESQEAIQ